MNAITDGARAFAEAAITGGGPEAWGEPMPLPQGLPPVASFNENLLPEALRLWVMDIANRMQCPPDFPAVAAIVCMSAVIGRQIGIMPKRRDDWVVVPNLWGAIVGRPSLMKTPALAESRKMLARLEVAAKKKHEAELAEYEVEQTITAMVGKEQTKGAANAVKKAMAEGGDPAAAARLALQSATEEKPRPARRRYTTQDPSVEKLGELLNETPRGMLVFRDELVGFLRVLDKDGHENDRAFYLEAWNGNGAYTYDRIGRGTIEIEAACISLLGGIQPGPLQAYIAQANAGGAGDDGLLQRLQMLVWPDRADGWLNVDEWPDTEAKNRIYAIFERLDRLTPHLSGAEITTLRFTDAAQDGFNAWREKFERRFLTEDMPQALEAHLTKYRSLLPSLALIFHLIDTPDDSAVGVEHVRRAEGWLVYLETHARRLYAQILDPGMIAALALSKRLGDLPEPFTARDVSQKGWAGLDREATGKALSVLTDFGHLALSEAETGGRPTKTYIKNPLLILPTPLNAAPSKPSKQSFEPFESGPPKGMVEKNADAPDADEMEL